MTDYAYARTSTTAQDGEGQKYELSELAGIPPERVILDRGLSGYSKMAMDRPGFAGLYAGLAPGDVITVPDLSRLGRDAVDVLTVVRALEKRDVGLVILSVGGAQVDTRTSLGKFFITMLAAIAELTRNQIADNTRLKLAALKSAGTYPEGHVTNSGIHRGGEKVILGRPSSITPEKIEAARSMKASGMHMNEIAKILGVAPSTLYARLAAAKT